MRQLPLPDRRTGRSGRPLRWAAVLLVVAASAGCVSVGDDEGKPAPGRSAERHGDGTAPDGGAVVSGGARGGQPAARGGEGGDKGKPDKPGASESGKARPSDEPDEDGHDASPTPTKTRTKTPRPTPTEKPTEPAPSPTPTPTEEPTPQPTGSAGAPETQTAYEKRIAEIDEREPSPQRGPM
ncbi:hypothetical protein ACIBI4_31600 [Streptomyces sp. NPDC050418]|uniref:hypothetical protein n=1 Tax=Streptomyces sp. NPDC050418 TaxID=3365612 RepID=UPI0037BB1137